MFLSTALAETGLVAPCRLGAALTAAREAASESLEEVQRRSGHRFTVATLRAVERGSHPVGDADLVALSELYGLPARPLAAGASELLLDRSTTVRPLPRRSLAQRWVDLDGVLARFLALRSLLERRSVGEAFGSVTEHDVDVLALALEAEEGEVAFRLDRLAHGEPERIEVQRGQLSLRPALPYVGVLVAELVTGTLVLVRRKTAHAAKLAGAGGLVAASAAVAPLAELLVDDDGGGPDPDETSVPAPASEVDAFEGDGEPVADAVPHGDGTGGAESLAEGSLDDTAFGTGAAPEPDDPTGGAAVLAATESADGVVEDGPADSHDVAGAEVVHFPGAELIEPLTIEAPDPGGDAGSPPGDGGGAEEPAPWDDAWGDLG